MYTNNPTGLDVASTILTLGTPKGSNNYDGEVVW